MQTSINTLKIGKCNLLLEDHLVEADDEVRIQETTVENAETEAATNKLEVVEVLRVDATVGVDLQSVVVVGRVLEQAVEGVEHLVRKQEEELSEQSQTRWEQSSNAPGDTSVIQTVFTLKLDHQTLLQVTGRLPHDLGVTSLEQVVTRNLDMTLASVGSERRLASEVDELSAEVTLVLRHVLIERTWQAGIVPRCRLGVVVDKVNASGGCQTHLPTAGQRSELADSLRLNSEVSTLRRDNTEELLTTRVDPGGGARVVVDEVGPSLGGESLFPTSW